MHATQMLIGIALLTFVRQCQSLASDIIREMLPKNDNKAIILSIECSILEINIIFFAAPWWWPRTGTRYEGAEFLEWAFLARFVLLEYPPYMKCNKSQNCLTVCNLIWTKWDKWCLGRRRRYALEIRCETEWGRGAKVGDSTINQ